MRKAFAIVALLLSVLLTLRAFLYFSFPLQDGYRLQGWLGSHGQIYRGYFTLVVEGEVMGVRGSRKGVISGWVGGFPNRYFILHTARGQIEWLDYSQQADRLAALGLPRPEMNQETNLAGLRSGTEIFARD